MKCKLTSQQVSEIWTRWNTTKDNCAVIARDYDVSETLIWKIINGEYWVHLRPRVIASKDGRLGKKLTSEDIPVIRQRANSESFAAVGRDYGIAGSVVGRIWARKLWKHVT